MTENTPTVREALKPFAFAADVAIDENDDGSCHIWEHPAAMNILIADLRRARAALEALPAPSGESVTVPSDGGWVEWSGGDCPVPAKTEGLLRVEDGEIIYSAEIDTFNFAHGPSGPYPGRQIVAYRVLSCIDAAPVLAPTADEGGAVTWRYESIDDDGNVTVHFTDNRKWVEQQRGVGFMPLCATLADRAEIDRGTAEAGEVRAGPVRDATDAMIASALQVDLSNEDEVALLHNVWHAMVAAHPVEEPGEVERQRGWIYFNPDAGTEWAENHPVESGEVPDAEDIRPGTSGELLKQLLPAWRDLATETSGRETAEADLAETRERLEKVEAALQPFATEAVEWALEWIGAPRPLVHLTPMTGRQTFRSQTDAIAFMRQQPSDATFVSLTEVRQTSMDRSDIIRAALTGDAQEAGR